MFFGKGMWSNNVGQKRYLVEVKLLCFYEYLSFDREACVQERGRERERVKPNEYE